MVGHTGRVGKNGRSVMNVITSKKGDVKIIITATNIKKRFTFPVYVQSKC